ncbi:hypothetical protein Tco_0116278 [Tanacetum coccineum]
MIVKKLGAPLTPPLTPSTFSLTPCPLPLPTLPTRSPVLSPRNSVTCRPALWVLILGGIISTRENMGNVRCGGGKSKPNTTSGGVLDVTIQYSENKGLRWWWFGSGVPTEYGWRCAPGVGYGWWCCMSSVDVIGGVVGWLLAEKLSRKKGGGGAKVEGDGVDVMMAAGWGEAGDALASVMCGGLATEWPEFGRFSVRRRRS